MALVGVVAIGRNEGERLVRCLASLPGVGKVVYVDSASSDDSVAQARRRGVDVVELDVTRPFSAARARNAGYERLMALCPELRYVQFVDGDCEVVGGWVEAAQAAMEAAPAVVAVCGWRRERHPEASRYNLLCDIEWRCGPVGETPNFGGDVLIRAQAFAAVGGYDERVIAAEDDELGVRLRRAGGRLLRIDRTSTFHDAAMTRLGQWWQRAKRCGHGFAQVSDMHGAPPENYFVREVRRVLLFGMAVPALAAALAPPTFGLSLSLLGIYSVQAWRTYQASRRRGLSPRESKLWAVSCTAAKVPEAVGLLKYRIDKLRRRQAEIIEYKRRPT